MERLGKYELVRRLAVGGMAELYLARPVGPQNIERQVVVKRLLPSFATDERLVRMFVNEARIAARLTHPNVVQIFDLGSAGTDYFLAMEYVAGQNLSEIQDQASATGVAVPYGIAAHIVACVCGGLYHAHTLADAEGRPLGLVHRDVSPQNVLLSFAGEVKLADFGIAKATALAAETQAGVLRGKYAYMSPEQCRSLRLDARSDLFSVGIILYELVCRRRLFRRHSEFATMRAILEDPIPPPSAVADDVPEALEAIVLRSLARRPEDRYPDARAMQLELEQAIVEGGWDVGPPATAQYLAQLFPLQGQPAEEITPRVIVAGPREVTQPELFGLAEPATTPGKPIAEAPTRPDGVLAARSATPVPPQPIVPRPSPAPPVQAEVLRRSDTEIDDILIKVPTLRDIVLEPSVAPPIGPADTMPSAPVFVRGTLPGAPPVAVTPGRSPGAPRSVPAPAHGAAPRVPAPGPLAPRVPAMLPWDDPQARLHTLAVTGLPLPARRSRVVYVIAAVVILVGGAALALGIRLWVTGSTPASLPVRITSEPEGATVYLDGEKRFGATPLVVHDVAVGREHKLLVLLEGYQPWRETFVLGRATPAPGFAAKLEPTRPGGLATLLVKASAEGAEVFLDGEKQGTAPISLEKVATGIPHTVVVRRDGFDEVTMPIDGLASGEKRTVEVALVPWKSGLKKGVDEGRRGKGPRGPSGPPATVPRTGGSSALKSDKVGQHLR